MKKWKDHDRDSKYEDGQEKRIKNKKKLTPYKRKKTRFFEDD